MNIFNNKKTYIQQKISSTVGRLALAFLMVMSLIVVFDSKSAVNAQSQYKAVDVHIPFDCKEIDGTDKNIYKISIKSETGLAPVPKNDTITVNNSGKGEFVISISEPGTYEYQIYEIKGSEKNIKYDETKYDVIIGVFTDEKGELSYSVAVTLAGTDDKPDSLEFENGAAGADKTTETDTRTEETTTEDVSEEETTESPSAKIDTPDKDQGKTKTADESMVVLMMIILVVSLAGTVVVGIKKRHKEI